MSDNSNKEVIEKLERINFLLDESLECNEYVNSGCLQEYGEKLQKVVVNANDLTNVPSVFKNCPVFPMDADEVNKAKQEYENKKKIFAYIALPTALFIIIYFISHWQFLNTLSVIGIFATIIYWTFFNKSKKDYKEKNSAYTESVKKSEKSIADFKKALSVYESEKTLGTEAAKAFTEKYNAAFEKYVNLVEEYNNSKQTAMKTVVDNMHEIEDMGFIPSEYYSFVKPMLSMLKSGRADNYKEALNMAIEEDRLAREEAARRAEEARRTRIMEEQAAAEQRRAEEMERHNRQMEAEQRRQNDIMLYEQKRQSQKLEKQQREAEREAQRNAEKARADAAKQANATKQAGIAKCASCANSRNCPSHIKNNGSGLNCGGYRPYGSR